MSALTVPSDAEIIAELVLELIDVQRVAPFKFGIRYDANNEPARVTVHKVTANGTMGQVEFKTMAASRAWCESALKEGYTVERLISRHDAHQATLSRRKRYYEQKIKYEAMSQTERKALDDDIPF
jgi:hypothetical protein